MDNTFISTKTLKSKDPTQQSSEGSTDGHPGCHKESPERSQGSLDVLPHKLQFPGFQLEIATFWSFQKEEMKGSLLNTRLDPFLLALIDVPLTALGT